MELHTHVIAPESPQQKLHGITVHANTVFTSPPLAQTALRRDQSEGDRDPHEKTMHLSQHLPCLFLVLRTE